MRVAVCFWQKEDLIWFPLFLSPSQFVCVSPSFSLSFSPSQWESFFRCSSLHQCSPLARLCASTRGRWWPCWGHETSVAMLVTMTGERKWRCLRDRWGGSHVLSLVSHLALSLSPLYSPLEWQSPQEVWFLNSVHTARRFQLEGFSLDFVVKVNDKLKAKSPITVILMRICITHIQYINSPKVFSFSTWNEA